VRIVDDASGIIREVAEQMQLEARFLTPKGATLEFDYWKQQNEFGWETSDGQFVVLDHHELALAYRMTRRPADYGLKEVARPV
jgi:hypothetical protein